MMSASLAFLSHDAHSHGGQLLSLSLVQGFVRDHGRSLHVLLGATGDLQSRFEAIAPTQVIPGMFNSPDPWLAAARRLRSDEVSVIVCNTTVSARAIRWLKEAGLGVILLVHELPTRLQEYKLEAAAIDAARMADTIVFPSAFVRDSFTKISGPPVGQTIIRHQGLYKEPLTLRERDNLRTTMRAKLRIPFDARIILGCGYGDFCKGLDLWGGLARRLCALRSDTYFVWVGTPHPQIERWLMHDFNALELGNQIRLPGRVADMNPYYAAADVFALTSREDSFPSVVLEAMSNNLPIVIFSGASGIEQFAQTAGARCVPYLDVDAMAAAIATTFDDGTLVDQLSGRAANLTQVLDQRKYVADILKLAEALEAQLNQRRILIGPH